MKTKNEILNIVKEVAKVHLDFDAEKITADTDLVADLGLDSLSTIDLIMAIEEKLGVELTDKEASECKSVEKLIDTLYAALSRVEGSVPA